MALAVTVMSMPVSMMSMTMAMLFLTLHVVSVLTVCARLTCQEVCSTAIAVHAEAVLLEALPAGIVVTLPVYDTGSMAFVAPTDVLNCRNSEIVGIVELC